MMKTLLLLALVATALAGCVVVPAYPDSTYSYGYDRHGYAYPYAYPSYGYGYYRHRYYGRQSP